MPTLAQQLPPAQPAASAAGLAAPSQCARGRRPTHQHGTTTLAWDQLPGSAQYQVQVIPLNNNGSGINLVIGDPASVNTQSYAISAPIMGQGNYIMLPGATLYLASTDHPGR